MAEIKSTLELALERSKKFSLSEKDKEEIKQKEIQEKILRLFYRYQKGDLHLHEIQKELDRMGEEMRRAVQEGLLLCWIDELSLEGENENILKGIEWLQDRTLDEVRVELRTLGIQYQSEVEQIKQEVRAQLLEALREEGFGGDALEPHLEASDVWQKALAPLKRNYFIRLRGLKDRLKSYKKGK